MESSRFFFRGSTWLSYRRISVGQVINTLLPQIRRQLRRLVQSPRPRPPQICRNSKQAAAEGAGNEQIPSQYPLKIRIFLINQGGILIC